MNAAVALYIYRLVPEFLMRFLAWLLVHTFYRVDKEGLDNIPEKGACIDRLQPRELRRRGRDRRVRAPADPLRDGPPHLPRAGAVVHLPHDAHDPDRAGARKIAALKDQRVRRGRRGARAPARSSASFPKASSPRRRARCASGRASSRCSRRRRCRSCRWRCAACGAASSAARANGKAMRRLRGIFSRIALVAAPPVPAERNARRAAGDGARAARRAQIGRWANTGARSAKVLK